MISGKSRQLQQRKALLPTKMMVNILLLLLFFPTTFGQDCNSFAPSAVLQGNKIFVSSTGEYLPIKGVNYYSRPNAGDYTLGNSQDFFTEAFRSGWERDIANFVALGVNAIRLYAVNPGQNHDAFMCALKAAGIYVIVGLAADCYDCAIQWVDPPNCYPQTLKQRGEFIIQQFAKYENVLAFSAGNEVSLSTSSFLGNLPCQKKFLRDMRAYIQHCTSSASMRHIPVGIDIADQEREIQSLYYACQTNAQDDLETTEFLGINNYLHCDGSATSIDQLVGYQQLLQDILSYGIEIPVMWTEFGCLNDSFETIDGYEAQRNFLEVEALFSAQFRQVFSGGFVFEYSTEKIYSEETSPFPFTSFGTGNYGVGYFSPENCDAVDIPCTYIPFPQFQTLASRYAAVDVSDEVNLNNYNPPNNALPACPSEIPPLDAFVWPTDTASDARVSSFQCPVLVPVFCAGVPGECVTVTVSSESTQNPIVTTIAPTVEPNAAIATSSTTSESPSSRPTTKGTTALPDPSATSETSQPTGSPTTATVTAGPTAPTALTSVTTDLLTESSPSSNSSSSPTTGPTTRPTTIGLDQTQTAATNNPTKGTTAPPDPSDTSETSQPTGSPTTATVTAGPTAPTALSSVTTDSLTELSPSSNSSSSSSPTTGPTARPTTIGLNQTQTAATNNNPNSAAPSMEMGSASPSKRPSTGTLVPSLGPSTLPSAMPTLAPTTMDPTANGETSVPTFPSSSSFLEKNLSDASSMEPTADWVVVDADQEGGPTINSGSAVTSSAPMRSNYYGGLWVTSAVLASPLLFAIVAVK